MYRMVFGIREITWWILKDNHKRTYNVSECKREGLVTELEGRTRHI